MGPKKAGKRLSTGGKGKGKRVSIGSAIERELALDMEIRVKSLRGIGNGRDEMGC
jgi:hypothetical protein